LCTPAIRPKSKQNREKTGKPKNSPRLYLKGGWGRPLEDSKCVEDGKYKKFVVPVKMFK
jgi:hypothetical protein